MRLIIYSIILLLVIGCENKINIPKEKKVLFEWDFNNQQKYVFSYFTNSTINFDYPSIGQSRSVKGFVEGKMVLESKENNLADLNLKNGNVYVKGDIAKDTLTNLTYNSYIRNIKTNGDFNSDSVDYVYKLLFYLPKKPIKIGDTEQFELKMPFTFNGEIYYAKGFYSIKYLTNGNLNDTKCSILMGDLDVSNIEFEEKLKEQIENGLEVKFTGKSKYYFDTKNKQLLGADIKTCYIMNSGEFLNSKSESIMIVRFDSKM